MPGCWAPACWPHSAFHPSLPIYLLKAKSSRYQTKTSPVSSHSETSFLCKSKRCICVIFVVSFQGKNWLLWDLSFDFRKTSSSLLTSFLHKNFCIFVMLSNSFILTSGNIEKFQSSSTKHFQLTCRCNMTNGIYWRHRHLFGGAIFVKPTRPSYNNFLLSDGSTLQRLCTSWPYQKNNKWHVFLFFFKSYFFFSVIDTKPETEMVQKQLGGNLLLQGILSTWIHFSYETT